MAIVKFLNNLTPFIPLSFKGEGETRKRGASVPLRHPEEEVNAKGE